MYSGRMERKKTRSPSVAVPLLKKLGITDQLLFILLAHYPLEDKPYRQQQSLIADRGYIANIYKKKKDTTVMASRLNSH